MSNEEKEENEAHEQKVVEGLREKAIEEYLSRISQEFRQGFDYLKRHPRSVTIFGSSMAPQDSSWCKKAHELAGRIAKEIGYTVITGGGPGIMEAASRGAVEAGGTAVGFKINLLREQTSNKFLSEGADFTYFFSRKTILAFAAETYIFFPGGYGTMDELFGILTLMQTAKIPRVPILLFDSSFWVPFKDFLSKSMLGQPKSIEPLDLELFEITDDYDRVIEVIRKAPVSEWWNSID